MSDFKATDLLNAIRNESSAEYQNRVPIATQNNLAATGTAIMDYSSTRNEFVSALLNRIGLVVIKNKLFENPLREFKKGTLDWGKDIEEVFVDLITAQTFDPAVAESEVFKRNLPNVQSIFHTVNRTEFYKTTVSNDQLKLAFLSENGFNSLIDKIVQAMYTSDSYDEYLQMKHLIEQYGVEGKFAMVPVSPVTDETSAKEAMITIKQISNAMVFMSTAYNFAGVHTNTLKEDQIILIDTHFDARVDVDVLAAAFNMDKADFVGRRVLIDDFGGLTNVLCAIVDRDWFMVYDKEISSEELYNPQGKYYNYFLHHWQTLSTSQFANAVLFVTVAPTLTSIIVTPATANVSKGSTLQIEVEAEGTGNPPAKVTYSLSALGTGSKTVISSNGLLAIDKNETAATITVTCTSTFDNTKTGTCIVTVTS